MYNPKYNQHYKEINMTDSQFTAKTSVESLKLETMDMTFKDVDREAYLKLFDRIKVQFGMEACAIFRDTVKADRGRFWIEPDDFAHMWRKIKKSSIISP